MEQSMTDALELNEIGRVVFTSNKPLFFDPYKQNKNTGAFILIDPITNNTCAVGMIIDKVNAKDLSTNITEDDRRRMRAGESIISAEARSRRYEQEGHIYNVTGEAADEFAYTLERRLFDIGKIVVVIDGRELKEADRIADTLFRQGLIVICIEGHAEGKNTTKCIAESNKVSASVENLIH